MITLCFNDIFIDYTKFKEFTEQFELYPPEDTVSEMLNRSLYYLLYNRYLGCSLAYETEDEFIAEFGIAYQEYFKQFVIKKEVLEKIHKLESDEFLIIAESLSNFSNNPNSIQTDPFELLTYTSNQQRGRTKVGKLQGYINALRQIPDAQINYIISKFDYLWLDILDTENKYLY